MSIVDFTALPEDLPRPEDDGAAAHLAGARMPEVELASTAGGSVNVGRVPGRVVYYFYPRTGKPGEPPPDGWDAIPGARGCTPQSCAFRDHHAELAALGAQVYGVSTQDTAYPAEAASRLHLPFPLLSDESLALAGALRLPLFTVAGMTLHRRLTLIVEDGVIVKLFYPVFPPDRNAEEVVSWLRERGG